MAYDIEGRLLEVCTCNVLCPCWVGEDPDNKTCDTVIAWGIEKGSIEGVDVGGLTMAVSAHIPKNILIPKSWKAVVFVDERATAEQEGAMLRLFTGQLGGAVADLAGLIGEVVAVERSPITFTVDGGKGRLDDREARRSRDGAVHGCDRQSDDARRDRVQHDPGLAGLREQGEPVHQGRKPARHPERGPQGSQRPAGPLPLRRLTARTAGTMFAPAHLRCARRDRALLGGALLALCRGSLARALAAGTGRPTGDYLHHETPAGLGGPLEASALRRGWPLMIVAMMLPTERAAPHDVRRLVGRRRQPGCW